MDAPREPDVRISGLGRAGLRFALLAFLVQASIALGQPIDGVLPQVAPPPVPPMQGEAAEDVPNDSLEGPETPEEEAPEPPEEPSYYVEPRSYGTKRDTEPPRYARQLKDIPFLDPTGEKDWLVLGADFRVRYEYRDDDFRRANPGLDEPFLLRERAYIGINEIFDPFRLGVEFVDAWRVNSEYPLDDRDVNRADFIQAFGELYFDDPLGIDKKMRFQAGRLAFEYLDRRLISRNEWRNTTNSFQGFRGIIGEQDDPWQLDLLAVQPLERPLFELDRAVEQQWFYGAIFDLRQYSEIATVQPYYLVLDQDGDADTAERELHNLAVRSYGVIGESNWDWDTDIAWQFGKSGARSIDAFGSTAEIGYTFDHEAKPRLSQFFGYGSGDSNPNDTTEGRFDRLFGFSRPWSANDYIRWENIIALKNRLEITPDKKLRLDAGYSAYWLASKTDVWSSTGLQDPTGQSGSFLGHELDARARWAATERLDVTVGYAHFIAGGFTKAQSHSDDSDFFYVQTETRLFK